MILNSKSFLKSPLERLLSLLTELVFKHYQGLFMRFMLLRKIMWKTVNEIVLRLVAEPIGGPLRKKILTSNSRSGFDPFPSRSADGRCPVMLSRTICRPIRRSSRHDRTPSYVAPRWRKRRLV